MDTYRYRENRQIHIDTQIKKKVQLIETQRPTDTHLHAYGDRC